MLFYICKWRRDFAMVRFRTSLFRVMRLWKCLTWWGVAWEQWWHGRSTMMSTSPSIANDSTTLCFTRLGRRKLWSIVWCFTSLYRTIFYFIINLLGTAVILSWSTASASSPKNANRSSSCNREKHCETVSSMQSTFITMNIFSTVSFATYFVCVSFEEQVGHAA